MTLLNLNELQMHNKLQLFSQLRKKPFFNISAYSSLKNKPEEDKVITVCKVKTKLTFSAHEKKLTLLAI